MRSHGTSLRKQFPAWTAGQAVAWDPPGTGSGPRGPEAGQVRGRVLDNRPGDTSPALHPSLVGSFLYNLRTSCHSNPHLGVEQKGTVTFRPEATGSSWEDSPHRVWGRFRRGKDLRRCKGTTRLPEARPQSGASSEFCGLSSASLLSFLPFLSPASETPSPFPMIIFPEV